MSKPRYRSVLLKDCAQGDRAYWQCAGQLFPITVIWLSPRKWRAGIHFGHDFNINATKRNWSDRVRVWRKVS